MSDDTPTQRFPEQGPGQPTERIATGEVYEELGEERQKSRGLLIGLIAAGVLLLIAIIVILFVIFGNKGTASDNDALPSPAPTDTASPQPSVSETPAATTEPTPQPSATQAPPPPPPPSTAVSIDSFTTSTKTVFCNTQAPNPTNQYLTFAWKTSNADSLKLGTYDPYGDYSDMYVNLPPDGNTDDMGLQITYFCPEASQKWRLTVTGNGQTVTKEIKIVNTGDTQ